jgi:hypothetical protein
MGVKTEAVKRWFRSKTMWFNIATMMVATANELLPIIDIVNSETSEALRLPLMLMNAFGNMILRRITNSPITF